MRPSFSVSLEPGLERGVPWGRDLFTFVTSAAGHMMRTLQKPRKSRPSKRQVNHRRFLHNMIQRKFADIEAANHRLASALYVKDIQEPPEPQGSASQSESLQDPDQNGGQTDAKGISRSRSDASVAREPKELDDEQKKSTNNQNKTNEKRRNNAAEISKVFQEPELLQSEYPNYQNQTNPMNNLPENNPNFIVLAQNEDDSPPFSPELSPLSLDSCDFSAQLLTDLPTDTEQETIRDITELFTDSVGHMDVESYFETICPRRVEDIILSGNFSGLEEDLRSDEVEPEYNFGYSCEEDRGGAADYVQRNPGNSCQPRQSEYKASTSICSVAEPQTHLEGSCCMLGNDPSVAPFEGVAQSFPVPPSRQERRPIPTPPHEDDWLFPDILKDRQLPYL